MRKIGNIIIFILIVGTLWHFYGSTFTQSGVQGVFTEMRSDFNELKENPKVITTVNYINEEVQHLLDKLNEMTSDQDKPNQTVPEQPQQDTLSKDSSAAYDIQLGNSRSDVEQQTGSPQRSSLNEYGVDWVTYHKNYRNFIMVAYNSENKVAGLYTNQNLLPSIKDITYETSKDTVRSMFDKPLESIRKGIVNYRLQNKQGYDMFHVDNKYITIFYDKHEDNTVTAVQIISDELERQKQSYFGKPSKELKKGLEYQLFDLTNAARVSRGLNPLTWQRSARKTARGHSTNMAESNFFGHTNPSGQSPFDRMREDNIDFRTAGENLAAGQPSSIFAHEGLMNSIGHRKNILKTNFEKLVIGVAFNNEAKPFYTETFWAD
ncbi:serine protease [Lentibacillus cibarius]|uniref:Serine protease n=1 Tax=Lentibacillus cibarius TaxID=2583219 RepID=A0A549YHF3_9BACI|nr:CAP domain-containing protein [Lentibacillus cibarius]TRM11277.1 serine protease [Lentibacillus cibarius]